MNPARSAPGRENPGRERIRNLQPAYFALVMATSIVAVACWLENLAPIARFLTWLNICLYLAVGSLMLARVIWFPAEVRADLLNHMRAPGFLTAAAGTALLGCQLILISNWYRAAVVLWIAGALLWVLLSYTIFTAFTVKEDKPALDKGINGGWLLAVVSTQAIAQLCLLLTPAFPDDRLALVFAGLALWLWGGMLYIWMISLIFYRYTFFRFAPSDLMPPYWINMGAMAISTLVGALLIRYVADSPLRELKPFVEGFTILFWATATWWIPMLVILGVWRHVVKRFPLSYDPLYWGAVFPLGVYTVATYRVAESLDIGFLFWVSRCFVYVALAAWLATFAGMVHGLFRPRKPVPDV